MKKIICLVCALLASLSLLAGCSKPASSVVSSGSASAVQSSSSASQQDASSGASASESQPAAVNFEDKLPALLEAAGIAASIPVMDIDVVGIYGIDKGNFTEFAGAQSKTVSQDGGEVLIVQATAGNAELVKAALETYRDKVVADDRYAEYQQARENVKGARIQVYGDVVVYASSATGEYDALDAALAAAFQ